MAKEQISKGATPRDVDVITTHINADFDALASMLAASRLYPGAMLVFPGAQERNLRNFFVESACYLYNFVKVKKVPFERVQRLIVVDTRQKRRIGELAKLAQDPKVEVHAYDHHPDDEDDIKASRQVVEMLGSTTAVMIKILRSQGVALSEDEATLCMLGIYEDTGSLTFNSTTPQDLRAAAWLLEQGANLNVVSSLISRELTPEEVDLLHDMIKYAEKRHLGGVEVTVTQLSRERYIPDLAVLVHRFMDMEDLDALFALARMEGRVYLVARSRLPEVDVLAICRHLGGGGHPTAASASIKDMTLVEAASRLESLIKTHINPTRTAGDIMSSPVTWVPPQTTVAQAHDALTRYGLNVLPVVERDKVLGVISRETVERAIHHDLAGLAVSEYMDRRAETLEPDSSLVQVEETLVGRGQRLLPVMEQGHLKGVITRTDLMQALLEQPPLAEHPAGSHPLRHKSIAGLMRERMDLSALDILSSMGRVAADLGYTLHLVGGSVRDLILRREISDLDVVVEGDGINLAKTFAKSQEGVKVRSHRKFQTANLRFTDGLGVDVATARLEYYHSPAALPVVELSSLKRDLFRRDFTINTLAVSLLPQNFGQILDFFHGLRDLKEKVVRVLHNLSLVEDPTRIFRAVRFEQRFGFRVGRLTEGLIKNAVKINALDRLTGSRLFGELRLLLEEAEPLDCLRRLNELDLLAQIHPSLKLQPKDEEILIRAMEGLAWHRLSFLGHPMRQWMVYMLALADSLKGAEVAGFCARLGMTNRFADEFTSQRQSAKRGLNLMQRRQPAPSVVHSILSPLDPEYQLYIMVKANKEWVTRAVSHYITSNKGLRPQLNGDDLKAMGLEPGPLFKEILDRLLAARLDGEITDMEGEIALVEREFGQGLEQTI